MKRGWYCEDCDRTVLAYAEHPGEEPGALAGSAVAESGLDLLPFPAAYPLAFARDTSLSSRERLDNVVFTAYQAMRITGLVLLADYLACNRASRRLETAIRGLRIPHWSEWGLLCDQLARFWSGHFPEEKPDRESYFPALAAGWMAVGMGRASKGTVWPELLAGLPGTSGPARSANDALWKLRNDRAHRMATRTPDMHEEAASLARFLPIVEQALSSLFPAGALTLLRCVSREPLRALRLHGPHRDFHFAEEALAGERSSLFERTDVAVLAGSGGIPVYPLIVSPEVELEGLPVPGGGLVEPITMIDGGNDRRMIVLGVRSFAERPDLAKPFFEALAVKQTEFGLRREETKRWTLVDWSGTTASEAVEAMRDRKYFPECYLERRGIDDLVEARLQKGRRGLLLLGEAGSGKSSLLARLVESLTARDEESEQPESRDVVLFLSGRSAFAGEAGWSSPKLLYAAVAQRAGVRPGEFTDLIDFVTRLSETARDDMDAERRVWVVLDALNEADRFADLVGAVDAFLPSLERFPWLRLVVSIRSGAYRSLERRHNDLARGGGVFENERFWFSFHEERTGENVPYLEIHPFNLDTEGKASYELRQERLPDHATRIPYDTLPPRLKALLLSPLHLHLFHETYRGRGEAPSRLDESVLFDAYLDKLGQELPGLGDTLREIGKLMYEQQTPVLPAEVADAWIASWRTQHGLDGASRIARLDPIEELVSASVLLRPAKEGIGFDRRVVAFQFSHQRLCERVLYRELMRQLSPRELPDAEELLAWAQHAAGNRERSPFAELVGALQTVAERLAEAGAGETLAALLDLENEDVRTAMLGAALRALGPIWGKSEIGEKLPATALNLLGKAALSRPERGTRFGGSSWQAYRWLVSAGFSRAAEAIARNQVRVMRGLVAAEPHHTDLRSDLCVALTGLARLARAAGRSEEARDYLEEVLSISRALVAAEPQRVDLQRGLCVALNRLGRVARAAGRGEKARDYLEEALSIMRALVAAEPRRADLRNDLCVALNSIGRVARATGRSDEARAYFEEALSIRHTLVAAEPQRADLQSDLCISLDRLGNLDRAAGRSEEARDHFEEALSIMRTLVAAEPHRADLQGKLCVALDSLGGLAEAAGRSEEARDYFEEALSIMRALVAAEPHRADLQSGLCVALNSLGRMARATGRREAAHEYFGEVLSIMRELVAAERHRLDLTIELAISYWNFVDLAAEPRDEVRYLRLVLDTLRPMRERGTENDQLVRLWDMASSALRNRGETVG